MIKIDGVHLTNDLGLKVLADSTDEMLPSTQDYTVNIPGRHGDYVFKAYFQPRQFDVSIIIPPQSSRMDVQLIARQISRMFLDQRGNPKDVELIYDYEPDKHYNVRFNGSIEIDRIMRMGAFEFTLTAYDPFAYSNVYSDEITWGSEVITFEYQYLLGREGLGGAVAINAPTTLSVPVDGYAIKPVFEISGSATALTVSTNGKSFALPSFTNASWVIDCEKYTVLKNGANAFGDVELREFLLNTGGNNVAITGTNININMRIKFRDKYM